MSDTEPTDEELATFLGDFTNNNQSEDSQAFQPLASYEAPNQEEPAHEIPEEPIKIGDGVCATCGAPTFRPPGLTRTGRLKRAPKYCDLHNPKLHGGRFDGDFTIQDVEAQLKKVQSELADDVMLFGTLAGPFFPVTGYYIVENADSFTTAVLKLCKNNTRMMRMLHRAAQVAPIYQVARFGAGVGVAVQVDQQKIDPHSMAADRLGVSRAYDAVYLNTATNSNFSYSSSGQSNSNFTGPPRYATVQ